MTRKSYNARRSTHVLRGFCKRYPWLKVTLEPGGAFAWQTGLLAIQIVDIVEDYGAKTAILNTSFTCHMPDCLGIPHHPTIHNVGPVGENGTARGGYAYRLGANSYLSGD